MNMAGVLGIDSYLGYKFASRGNDPSNGVTSSNHFCEGFWGQFLNDPVRGSANQKAIEPVREFEQLLFGFRQIGGCLDSFLAQLLHSLGIGFSQAALGFYDGVSRQSELAFKIRNLAFGALQYIFCFKPAFSSAKAGSLK